MKEKTVKAAPGATDERVEMVRVRPNPSLFRGCSGQVVVTVNGKKCTVHSGTVTEVSSEAFAEMQATEINGLPAVVKA